MSSLERAEEKKTCLQNASDDLVIKLQIAFSEHWTALSCLEHRE